MKKVEGFVNQFVNRNVNQNEDGNRNKAEEQENVRKTCQEALFRVGMQTACFDVLNGSVVGKIFKLLIKGWILKNLEMAIFHALKTFFLSFGNNGMSVG